MDGPFCIVLHRRPRDASSSPSLSSRHKSSHRPSSRARRSVRWWRCTRSRGRGVVPAAFPGPAPAVAPSPVALPFAPLHRTCPRQAAVVRPQAEVVAAKPQLPCPPAELGNHDQGTSTPGYGARAAAGGARVAAGGAAAPSLSLAWGNGSALLFYILEIRING